MSMKLPIFIMAATAIAIAAVSKPMPPQDVYERTVLRERAYGGAEADDRMGDDADYRIQAEEEAPAFQDEWAMDEGDPEAEENY